MLTDVEAVDRSVAVNKFALTRTYVVLAEELSTRAAHGPYHSYFITGCSSNFADTIEAWGALWSSICEDALTGGSRTICEVTSTVEAVLDCVSFVEAPFVLAGAP